MPSNTKSRSKTRSRLSNSDQCASNGSPSVTPSADLEASDDDLQCLLENAAIEYPNLIGNSAFIGRVSSVESESKGCKIWLSEPSMVASSLAPGSIVSVSLASKRTQFSNNCLSSLADACATHFGVDFGTNMDDKVGTYFALATVFPSCKVLKEGVRLSSNLSYTLGCPATGTVVFIFRITNPILPGPPNKCDKPHSAGDNCLSLHKCKELYLELAPPRNHSTMKNNMFSPIKSRTDRAHDQFENGVISSPKTPVFHSKLSSTNTYQLTSAVLENTVSSSPNQNSSSSNPIDIREVLGDENAKKLMQICATSWLYSRTLLCGNHVAIPILSELCIFHVIGANKLSPDSTYHDRTDVNGHDFSPKVLEPLDYNNDAFVVGSETKVYLSSGLNSEFEATQKRCLPGVESGCEDVKPVMGSNNLKLGGLSNEVAILKDIISSLMKGTLSSLGLQHTKGVLLHGPLGTGKTKLAQLCAHDAGVSCFSVTGPEIVTQYFGESEKALEEVFDSARRAAPSVIIIDEIDVIAPARREGGEDISQRIVVTLLNLMDGISSTHGLLVIASTNRPDSLDSALRRPGRFDREIEIGVPSAKQRLEILLTILGEMEHSLLENQIQHIAMTTHGYVGADLASLCHKAAYNCLKRYAKSEESSDNLHSTKTAVSSEGHSEVVTEGSGDLRETTDFSSDKSDSASSSSSNFPIPLETIHTVSLPRTCAENTDNIQKHINNSCEKAHLMEEECNLKMTYEDFEKARLIVRPSAMREVILEVPKVNWADVGGQNEVKAELMEAVVWPQKYQDEMKRTGTKPPAGILMFGPPGCSKTLMARAVASESGLNFLAVKGPELFSKWVGESEKAVRSLFAKARANAPSIIFFDEIDALGVTRGKDGDGISVGDRVLSQLLVELDGLHERGNVTVIAATNRPDKIDPALLRPGRFDKLVYVRLPNEMDREQIFQIHLRKTPCSSNANTRELARLTEGYTGADIPLICREAAIAALEESFDASEITMQHLKTALLRVQPSYDQSYEEQLGEFRRLIPSRTTNDALQNRHCSSNSNWFLNWFLVKSIVLFLYRWPIALFRSRPA